MIPVPTVPLMDIDTGPLHEPEQSSPGPTAVEATFHTGRAFPSRNSSPRSNSERGMIGGVVIGLVATQVIRRWIGPLLFQTSPSDPGVMAAVALGLIGVAISATLVPTVRCLRRNPATILRE